MNTEAANIKTTSIKTASPRPATPKAAAKNFLSLKTHRFIRQLHLWIGAWGAIAAIVFGFTGFMQNHRGSIMKLPQGDTNEISSVELAVPESARASREAMKTWLHDTQHLDVEIARPRGPGGAGGPGGPGGAGSGAERAGRGGADAGDSGDRAGRGEGAGRRGGEGGGPGDSGGEGAGRRGERMGMGGGREGGGQSNRWMFNGGNARLTTQVEYTAGAETATIRKTENTPLAVLERLHKGTGGGVAWIILSDSFAIAMVMLGLSGIILWARGRTWRQMAFSILGVAVVVIALIGGSAII